MRTTKMIKNLRAAALILFVGLSMAGCAASVPNPTFPDLTFRHLGPINLNVGALENATAYKAPLAGPNVEHLFPVPPGAALGRWAADRLVAAGDPGEGAMARFTILDASVLETALEMKKGLTGAFTKDQSERYDAMLTASLEIFDAGGTRKGFANATTKRSITVREDATVNQREQAWFSLTEALMKDISAELEKNISQYLGDWLM